MNQNNDIFFDHLKRQIKVSISTSAFRNQGKSGLIHHTQEYLYKGINLNDFARSLKNKNFDSYLDRQTFLLAKSARKYKCKWGTARKGLNIFFRDVL